jgi:co-chaperonin GroES (HSP10)
MEQKYNYFVEKLAEKEELDKVIYNKDEKYKKETIEFALYSIFRIGDRIPQPMGRLIILDDEDLQYFKTKYIDKAIKEKEEEIRLLKEKYINNIQPMKTIAYKILLSLVEVEQKPSTTLIVPKTESKIKKAKVISVPEGEFEIKLNDIVLINFSDLIEVEIESVKYYVAESKNVLVIL